MEKNYAKGSFVDARTTQYGELVNLDIKKNEFIEWLNSLKVDERGFIRLQASKRKDAVADAKGRTKWSLWENDFVRTQAPAPAAAESSTDDLPF